MLQAGAGNGVTTIALTQSDTPVALAADMVVAVNVPEGNNIFRPTSSRYAYLAAVDVLATLAAYHHRQRSMVTLRHIKQQLVEHRDPDDRQLLVTRAFPVSRVAVSRPENA